VPFARASDRATAARRPAFDVVVQRTCLHLAASTGNRMVVEALVEHGVNLRAVDRWGGTALADAVREGHAQVAELLRAHGAELLLSTT